MAVTINRGRALEGLNILPLIDIVFLLLIFFMVSTKFAEEERELAVTLPDASQAQPLTSNPRELYVNVTKDGKYYVSGKTLPLDELRKTLKAAYVNNPGRVSVTIRTDKRAPTQYPVDVMDACLRANIRDYKLTISKRRG